MESPRHETSKAVCDSTEDHQSRKVDEMTYGQRTRRRKKTRDLDVKAESTDTALDYRPEPASWSVLRRTVPDLFQLDADHQQSIFSAADLLPLSTLSLPDEDWFRLATVSIYDDDAFYDLLTLTVGYLVELRLAPRSFETIIGVFRKLSEHHTGVAPKRNELSSNQIITFSEIAAIKNFRLESFKLPNELLNRLHEKGLITWGDLTKKTEKSIVDTTCLDFEAFSTISDIWATKGFARAALSKLSRSITSTSFSEMANDFVALSARSGRDSAILEGRLGLLEPDKLTLQDLGTKFGITRERIRQIEAKRIRSLRHPTRLAKLAAFRLAVNETLRTSGGICFVDELATGISEKLGWSDEPNDVPLSSFVDLFGGVEVDKESNIVSDPNHRCVKCGTVLSYLENIFVEDNREKSLSDIGARLRLYCANTNGCKTYSTYLNFSKGFINFVASKTDSVLVEDELVYCHDTWIARRGSRMQFVESILTSAGRPMHFSEVCEKARILSPDDHKITESNIHNWLDRSDNLLLWDRGTFIHCDFVSPPLGVIADIESWLAKKLNAGVPFVNIAGAYNMFLDECSKSRIASESALYACLRKWGKSKLHYPSYPQVYLKEGFDSLIPAVIAVEQFIRDAGGEVPYSTLREYALTDLCLKEFQFQQCLHKLPNVAKTKIGFVHTDSLNVDLGNLGVLTNYIGETLHKIEHVSIVKIFNDKRVTCTMLGIDSPEMLCSILRLTSADEYDLSTYPLLRFANRTSTPDQRRGVLAQIAEYIRVRSAPCSMDELETRFVEELGFREANVHAVTGVNGILRFGKGTLIHLDTLEWTNDKQSQLEAEAREAAVQARNVGRCYAKVSDLLEYHQLPVLGKGIMWTRTLLAELLAKGHQFRILGNTRNAFVPTPNDRGIETFQDLVYELLMTDYEGASDIRSFEQSLREAGIILNKLTPGMLGNQGKVTMDGQLIMLRDLGAHA